MIGKKSSIRYHLIITEYIIIVSANEHFVCGDVSNQITSAVHHISWFFFHPWGFDIMTEMNSPASNGNPQPPPTAPDNAATPTITPKTCHFSTLAQTGSGNRHQAKSSENKIACWFEIKLRTICEFAVVMPLGGMLICLITALTFQFEHIQETACKVSFEKIECTI